MRRLALALVIGLISFSTSGMATLFVPEACALFERAGDDRDCPPTCVTCGCCGQAVEPVVIPIGSSPEHLLTHLALLPRRILDTIPADILHVPKTVPA